MILDLPQINVPFYNIYVYSSKGIYGVQQGAENPYLEVPNDVYLVIVHAQLANKKIVASYGYDRARWLPYKPEYHNSERLMPKPKPQPKPQPVITVTEDKEEKLETDGKNAE